MVKWFWKHHWDNLKFLGALILLKSWSCTAQQKHQGSDPGLFKIQTREAALNQAFLLLGVCLDTNLPAVLATAGTLLVKIIYYAAWHSSD